jgi:hypothetical protein
VQSVFVLVYAFLQKLACVQVCPVACVQVCPVACVQVYFLMDLFPFFFFYYLLVV